MNKSCKFAFCEMMIWAMSRVHRWRATWATISAAALYLFMIYMSLCTAKERTRRLVQCLMVNESSRQARKTNMGIRMPCPYVPCNSVGRMIPDLHTYVNCGILSLFLSLCKQCAQTHRERERERERETNMPCMHTYQAYMSAAYLDLSWSAARIVSQKNLTAQEYRRIHEQSWASSVWRGENGYEKVPKSVSRKLGSCLRVSHVIIRLHSYNHAHT